jgi:hypothetical protein
MVKDYIHYSTYVEVRCPIDDNGRIGQPEVVRKFTNQWLASKSKIDKKKKKEVKTLTIDSNIAVEEL